MTQQKTNEQHEWFYPLDAESISDRPVVLEISPDKEQCEALCRRLDLAKIKSLVAKLRIQRNPGNMIIYISAELNARIVQNCVATLAPVEQDITDSFEGWFADPAQAVSFTKAKRERMNLKEKIEQPILDESEDPEAIIDGVIDLGEFVAQHFSLALDPYPRVDGAEPQIVGIIGDKGDPEDAYDNPFAALKEWRAKENKDEA